MTRSHAIGAAVLVCAVLAALLVWLVNYDEPRAERAADEPKSERVGESTQLAASELAQAPTTSEARSAASAVPVAEASDATEPTAEAPHLVITRGGAPLVGAHVELWNGPLVGTVESFVFTSDAEGRVPLPAGLEARGPWFALAGGDGACSERLEPLAIDTLAPSTEVRCVDMQHLAVVFERSDGAPLGAWPGVHPSLPLGGTKDGERFGRPNPSAAVSRCLFAAGLDAAHARPEVEMTFVTWEPASTLEFQTIRGRFAEPDTDEVEWSAQVVPLALGGALARVALPVHDEVAVGFVHVTFAGAQATEVLERSRWVTVGLRRPGSEDWDLGLVVKGLEAGLERSQSLFTVPAGTYRADLSLDLPSITVSDSEPEPLPLEVVADATTSIEFELPSVGTLVFDPESLAEFAAYGKTVVFQLVDAESGAQVAHHARVDSERVSLVPAGRWLVRTVGSFEGLVVPSGSASVLAGDVERYRALSQAFPRLMYEPTAPELPALIASWAIDVRAGGETPVSFVSRRAQAEPR